MVKPSGINRAKVPMMETGMANTGINVALQLCRNKKYDQYHQPQCFQQSDYHFAEWILATTDTLSNGTT